METVEERRSLPEVIKSLVKILVIVGIIIGAGFLMKFLFDSYMESKRTIPTPENNVAIANKQLEKYNPIYMMRDPGGPEGDAPLIDYNVLGCRFTGYLGPTKSGVFNEDAAVNLALRAGCRVFCLNIGTVDAIDGPVLVVRTGNGDLISNNVGSINKVCQALERHSTTRDPIIIFLYFNRLPSVNMYSPETMKFMMNVATGLQPLRNRHLGLTSEGDYRRQKMQDTLFLRSRSLFDGKFIILTNVDTSGFRPGVLPSNKGIPEINPNNDLDLWTNARISTYTSVSLGLTTPPKLSTASGPRVETVDYFMGIGESGMVQAIGNSAVNWTIAMNNAPDYEPIPPNKLDKMLDKTGVACVLVDVFTDGLFADNMILSKKYFGKSGWRLKPEGLRYVKPKEEKIGAQNPQANTSTRIAF